MALSKAQQEVLSAIELINTEYYDGADIASIVRIIGIPCGTIKNADDIQKIINQLEWMNEIHVHTFIREGYWKGMVESKTGHNSFCQECMKKYPIAIPGKDVIGIGD